MLPSPEELIPGFQSIENEADWMPSWVSLSHSYADFSFFKLPEPRPAHSRVQSHTHMRGASVFVGQKIQSEREAER